MPPINPHSPNPEPSSTASKSKRKHFHNNPRHYRHHESPGKRQKSIRQTETLKPHRRLLHPSRYLPIHTSYCPSPSSSSRRRNNNRRRRGSIRNSNLPEEFNREWTFSSRDCSSFKDKIVVVSYNILGVENALKHPDLYKNVPPKYLEWGHRKELICEEIFHYNASILCFQEVDRFNDLDDLLQKDGFRGVYRVRTGEARDGCAIFWKDNLFTLLHEEQIEFQSFGLRNNVAQLCVLKMKENQSEAGLFNQASKTTPFLSRSVVIGNIHVLFNPNRGDIKLGQVRLFLETAYKLSQEWGNIPVIIGGDLNSMPQSAMYQFLAASELNILQYDRRSISGQLEHSSWDRVLRYHSENVASGYKSMSRPLMYRWSDEELTLATGSKRGTYIQHQLNLCSAYHGVPGSRRSRDDCGEPLATSYHSKFMGTVDYIWHTAELIPIRVLETLPIDILRSGGLPNKRWGSDHLALVCELAFLDEGNNT